VEAQLISWPSYFGFFGSHYNSSVDSVKSRLQNMKSQYQYAQLKVLTVEHLELWAILCICWSFRFSSVSAPYYRNCAVLLKLP